MLYKNVVKSIKKNIKYHKTFIIESNTKSPKL